MFSYTFSNGIQNPFWHWKFTFTLHKFDDFPDLIFFQSGDFDTSMFFQPSTVYVVFRNNSPVASSWFEVVGSLQSKQNAGLSEQQQGYLFQRT